MKLIITSFYCILSHLVFEQGFGHAATTILSNADHSVAPILHHFGGA